MWRLFRPLRYFALRNGEKTAIDILGTIALTGLILLPFLLVPDASFFRAGGFMDRLIGLMSALTGFFVAALVAAATFAHPDLDAVMTSGAVEMKVKEDGRVRWQKLTRRELACAIFGYLSFAAFLFSVAAAITVPITTAEPSMPAFVQGEAADFISRHKSDLRLLAMVIVVIPLAHIMTATGLGVFYLMERLHYRRPVIVTKADAA